MDNLFCYAEPTLSSHEIEQPETCPDIPDFTEDKLGMYNFIDTEGVGYEGGTDGTSYDTVTILPHMLISENVFLVVRDRHMVHIVITFL